MQYNSICYADIETFSIPASGVFDVEEIHCIAVKSNNEPTLIYTSRFLPLPNYGGTLRNALDFINSHEYCVFHNGIGFDIPVITTLLGSITSKPLDSMLIAKLLYTKDELISLDCTIIDFPKDKYGSFSLDAFGRRMGEYKGSYSDWSRLTSEMCSYCTQDVEVTYHLFQHLIAHDHYPSQDIISLENEVASIIAEQQYLGFHIDLEACRTLLKEMMHEQLTIELRLQKQFRPMFLPDGPPVVPAGPRRNKIYLPDTSYRKF